MIEGLIAPILSAASRAIASAVKHANDGNIDRANLVVKKFVAATAADLEKDEQDALNALGDRFVR